MKSAFVFPGQGSQKVGMGETFFRDSEAARRVFEEADDVLGFALSKLCFEGPEADLQLTENTQPAILATSIAIYREALERSSVRPDVVAGHSLGEYSALVVAGALELATALRLVRRRGQLMQEAVPVGRGAMAAILGLDQDKVEQAARDATGQTGKVCSIANLNAPGQVVIAGDLEGVEAAMEIAKGLGARRAVLLPVSAPFHSSLMAPARSGMEPLLREAEICDPQILVVCNVDAVPVRDGEAARAALIRQIDSPVRWIESVRWMLEQGVSRFFEFGPGAVLAGLIRRIDKSTKPICLAKLEDLEKLSGEKTG